MRRFALSGSVVGIVLLAGLTAVIALAALRGPESPAGSSPAPIGSALTDPPSLGAGTDPGKDVTAPDVEPPLSMVDSATAYRGSVGTCTGGASLERTLDGGATWEDAKLPPGTTALTKVDALSAVVVRAVAAAGEKCESASWATPTAGRSWQGPGPTAGLWFRPADTNKRIQTPSGTGRNPCTDRDEAVREINGVDRVFGALLCADGVVRTTADGGQEWRKVSAVPGAVALAWATNAEGWLLTDEPIDAGGGSCPGYQLVSTVDGGLNWLPGGCVGKASDASAKATSPSLDFLDVQLGMVSLASGAYVTDDRGLNWQRSRG